MFLRKKAHNLFAKSIKLALKNSPRVTCKFVEQEEVHEEEIKPKKNQKAKKEETE